MKCSKCGYEIKKDAKFCSHCGEKVNQEEKKEYKPKFCTNCGEKIKKDDKVCSKCGQVIDKKIQEEDTIQNYIIYVTSFLIPFFGIAFYLLTKNDNKSRAKIALTIELVRIGINIMFIIQTIILVILGLFISVI